MIKKILVLLALSAASLFAASGAQAGCGHFAIFECSKTGDPGGRGYMIRTDDYDNFRAGWNCRVQGPFDSKSQAKSAARSGGGYVKYSCQQGDGD